MNSDLAYWSIIVDISVMSPQGERRRGLLTLGFSWRGIFRRPRIERFDHGFDALFAGLWLGLERPVATPAHT